MRRLSPYAAALAGAALFAAPSGAENDVELSAEDLLAPYYAKLESEITLPVAPANVSLAPDRVITRFAFGSCNHQLRSQHMWAQIAATDPQLFLFIGDNNYGDQGWDGDAALTTLREAYGVQANTPELADFRARVPMMVTWDDHDFGFNDGGATFAFRRWAETIYEAFWGSSDAVKSRPGIYESRMFGSDGKITQVIMLDTRFFRSDLDTLDYTPERPPLGPYRPSGDTSKTMLGEAQWTWLDQELAKPADLRILVSSIQVITDAHDYESWEALPHERARLYAMLAGREESGLLMLSGDRHAGGIYRDAPEAGGGETLWELTSSSLNYAFSSTASNTAREPDPRRLTDFISEENFGLVEIDWDARTFTMSLRGSAGEVRVMRTESW
ncbi:alkaline phosphatase [Erythrobacter sp. JK5]|uniref:alkaline phosphatase D family protein n=1 Tax=Erythrobacter sp. JK5 TaxID=2829500 RepID=UPI001BA53DC2|nr:alkaline phosphatase D family protein [Erythrobacter sp. JK5]QUL36454.1 alkaline phosphatase family protein [Erythrobacter sp. JK5]